VVDVATLRREQAVAIAHRIDGLVEFCRRLPSLPIPCLTTVLGPDRHRRAISARAFRYKRRAGSFFLVGNPTVVSCHYHRSGRLRTDSDDISASSARLPLHHTPGGMMLRVAIGPMAYRPEACLNFTGPCVSG